MEGFIVVPRVVLNGASAHNSDPLRKRVRHEAAPPTSAISSSSVDDRDGSVLVKDLSSEAAIAAALNAGMSEGCARAAYAVTVEETTDAFTVYKIQTLPGEPQCQLPRYITTTDGVALHVFTDSPPPASVPAAGPAPSVSLARPILLVGAGGIGCELLKLLVLSGFKHIELMDLDTIDATNLNRQFLFTSADVGMSKAVTARAAVLRWFTERHRQFPQWCVGDGVTAAAPPTIVAYHDNVKNEDMFGEAFFSRFAAVLNALDNVSARQHVNRMCMRVGVPLFESGTMGYNGQVQPILKGRTECYDCRPKPADQKTFAVCTIHARPTTMVHCVHYAKELYASLFGERSAVAAAAGACAADTATANGSVAGGGGAGEGGEMAYLGPVVRAWVDAVRGTAGDLADAQTSLLPFARALLECVFRTQICQLLAMKSLWPTEPPVPLDTAVVVDVLGEDGGLARTAAAPHLPRDTALTVGQAVQLFLSATVACVARILRALRGGAIALRSLAPTGASTTVQTSDGRGEQGAVVAESDAVLAAGVPFMKEDNIAVDFVGAAAYLRAHVFHIATCTVEEVRGIAGAIVPAIATTNAMVAAGVVQQLLAHERWGETAARMMYVRKVPLARRRRTVCAEPLLHMCCDAGTGAGGEHEVRRGGESVVDRFVMYSAEPSPPCRTCRVCAAHQMPTVTVHVASLASCTLETVACDVCETVLGMEGPSLAVGARIVYETEDYVELAKHPLSAFATRDGDGACVTLTVDALNKDVAWRVVVRAAEVVNGKCPEPAAVAGFRVSGVEKALAAEAHALADARAAEADEEAAAEVTAESHRGTEGKEGATADTALTVDDEDELATPATGGTMTTACEDTEVIEID